MEPVDNSYYGITGFANGQMRVAFIRSNAMLDTKGSIQIDGHRLSGGVILASGEGLRENWLKVCHYRLTRSKIQSKKLKPFSPNSEFITRKSFCR